MFIFLSFETLLLRKNLGTWHDFNTRQNIIVSLKTGTKV